MVILKFSLQYILIYQNRIWQRTSWHGLKRTHRRGGDGGKEGEEREGEEGYQQS